ncbi:hypothetical protein GM160_04935 [Guyparkeria halophila]|uniref:Polysaccharide chain length determinant N-terminal domain-containing protein n=2 Tax=Guyparkeria halophila TaxID=47960 RepID=A0A6I6D2C1_9GAMM|nr:hypothetical protein GM160_04935 [Guyparkeria halophila]
MKKDESMNEIRPSQPRTTNPPRFDDEIDLVDLALALWRRKWTVVVVALIFMVLAALYAFARGDGIKASSYASIYSLPKSVDENGNDHYIIGPSSVMELTERVFVPKSLKEDRQAKSSESWRELEIGLDHPKSTSLIVLETQATENEAKRVETLHESIIERIAGLVESEVDDLREKLDRRIEMLETRLANAESLAESLAQTDGDLADISLEISKVKADLLSAELEKSSLASGRLVELGQQRDLDEGVSGKLIVALGAILGLFAGLFAALMVNFIAAARERLHDELDAED